MKRSCIYIDSFSGNQCTEKVYKRSNYCFWHIQIDGKKDITKRLTEKAKAGKELFALYLKKADLKGAELRNIKIRDADLRGANLEGSILEGSDLRNSKLQKTNFKNANLREVDFREANLWKANLEGTDLWGSNLEGANLNSVNWDKNYILKSERKARENIKEGDKEKALCYFAEAIELYRAIKNNCSVRGDHEIAGIFYYREMESKYKSAKALPSKMMLWIYRMLCGYGEKPFRIFFFSLIFVLIFSLFYLTIPELNCLTKVLSGIQKGSSILSWQEFSDIFNSIYFSVVTFTTLGYGDLKPIGIAKVFSMIESFSGAFLIALFIFVFARKMLR